MVKRGGKEDEQRLSVCPPLPTPLPFPSLRAPGTRQSPSPTLSPAVLCRVHWGGEADGIGLDQEGIPLWAQVLQSHASPAELDGFWGGGIKAGILGGWL